MMLLSRLALAGIPLALCACSSGPTAEKMAQIKPGMTPEQVQAILGRPASIEQSETADQTISGEVDHYPASNGEGRVVIVNHTVFQAQFVPATKS
jgi:SmpA / OmlA family